MLGYSLPTGLTWLRIFFIPLFIGLFFSPLPHTRFICAILFIVAAVTDWLDGYLARRWQQTSAFGAFLDPVADKLMITAALVLLVQTMPTPFMAITAIIIIGREIAISALREWLAELGQRTAVAVSWLGKIKTTAQMIAIVLLIYREPLFGLPTLMIGSVLLVVAAVLTLGSMIHYLWIAWPILQPRSMD